MKKTDGEVNDKEADIKTLFKLVKLNRTKPAELETILDRHQLDINVRNGWQETLIYNCAKHAVNIKLMDWLHSKGCDPALINSKGLNAYDACLKWNRKSKVNLVLNWLENKDIGIQRHYPSLPKLHNIIICYPDGAIYEWAKKQFDLNEQDIQSGNTPLHIACHQDTEHNSPFATEWLCRNGADLNKQNLSGQTALHLAAEAAFSNCIQIILDAEGDRTIQDNQGRTPLDALIANKEQIPNLKWHGNYDRALGKLTQQDSNNKKGKKLSVSVSL
jgi:ankyrin repeat protein